jgi:hypothetical protein
VRKYANKASQVPWDQRGSACPSRGWDPDQELARTSDLEQEDTGDGQPSRLKWARSRFVDGAAVDSDDEDELDEPLGSTQQTIWSKRAQSGFAALDRRGTSR